MVLGTIISIIALVCAIYVIYDVVTQQKKMSTVKKIIWIVCAVFFSILTALIYYFVYKN